METLSERIKKYRSLAGLTQQQLADRSGLAKITIQGYESGKFSPKYDSVARMAAALNISPVELLYSKEERELDDAIESGRDGLTDYFDRLLEQEERKAASHFLEKMKKIDKEVTYDGKNKILSFAEYIADNPEYKLDPD